MYLMRSVCIIVGLPQVHGRKENTMDIHFRKRGKIVIAEIEGDIDHHTADGIRRMAERELYISGADSLVLDMGGVGFMDSSGIGMIIGRYKTVTALGGRLAIVNPSKEANRILSISGIYRLVRSYPTAEDAVLGINQEVQAQ